MKKSMKIALSFLLVWAAIFPSFVHSDSVAAAGDIYEDGEYDIPFEVLQEDSDDISSAGGNIVSPGALTIVDGKYEVTVTMTETNYFKDFLIETEQLGSFEDKDFAEVETVSVDEEKDERVVKFMVQDLDEILNAKVGIHTPMGEMNHNIRLSFDTREIDVLPDSDDDTGEYDIPFEVLKEENDDISSAGSNIVSPGALAIVDGKYEVTVTMTETNYFKDFLIETEQLGSFEDEDFAEVETVSVDEEKDERVVKFMVQDLDEILHAKVGIHTPMGEMNHNIRLSFDTTELDLPQIPAPNPDEDNGEDQNDKDKDKDQDQDQDKDKDTGNDEAVIDPKNLKDGVYSLDFEIQESNSAGLSMMDQFAETPGHLKVKDGKKYIAMNFTNRTWITDFQTEKNGKLVQAKSLSFNYVEKGEELIDEGVVEFEVADLSKRLDAQVAVDVPGVYTSTHDVGTSFNEDSLKQVPASEYPEDQEAGEEDSGDQNDQEKVKSKEKGKAGGKGGTVVDPDNLKDGIYSIEFEIQESNSDGLSMMDQYAETPGHLKVKDGKKYIAMNFTNRTWITDFQTEKNGKLVPAKSLSFNYVEKDDELVDEGVVEFEVADLSKRLNAEVAVDVPGVYASTHDVGISFNEESIKQVSDDKYPKDEGVSQPPGKKSPADQKERKDNNAVTDAIDTHNLADGMYTIPFEVLHATLDEESMMAEYVENPGYLRVENGKHYIAITLLQSDWITDFKTEVNGELTNPKTLSTDQDKDSEIVEFEVEDIFSLLNAWIEVDVPGVYASDHDVLLSFDTDAIQAISEDEYPGLGFDRNGDLEQADQQSKGDQSNNPRTADTTNIMKIIFLSLLLVGSMIPLIKRYRNREQTNE